MTNEEVVRFEGFDGVRLVGTLARPDAPSWGRALLTHGLPSDREESGFYRDFAERLAGAGIESLRFDFRSCGDSEPGAFPEITLSDLVNDIDAAARTLLAQDDGHPFFLVSTSASGGAGLIWAALADRPIERIFLMAPVLDYWAEVVGRPSRGDFPDLTSAEADELRSVGEVSFGEHYGRVFIGEARLLAAAGIPRAKAPTTIFHGTEDTVVDFDSSRRAAANDSSIELIPVGGADHGFAVEGDDDLTAPATKANHETVYAEVIKRALSSIAHE